MRFANKGAFGFQETKGMDALSVLDLVIPVGRGTEFFEKDESWCFSTLV